jgi:hypothetical protein
MNPRKNDQGFSLIEILLSIAFFAMVAITGAGWMNLLNNEAQGTNENLAISGAITKSTYALGDTDLYCTKIVGRLDDGTKRPFDLANAAGTTLKSIDFYDSTATTKLANVVQENAKLDPRSGVVLKELRLRPVSNMAPGVALSSLDFTFTKIAKQGPQQIVRKIPLYVTVQNGVIEKCSTELATLLVSIRLCDAQSDGYSTWDPLKEECKENADVKWFPSANPAVALCPGGWKPALSGLEPAPNLVACISKATLGMNIPPRVYMSNYVDNTEIQGFVSTYDPTVGACRFAFTTGSVPYANASQIKCVPGTFVPTTNLAAGPQPSPTPASGTKGGGGSSR